MTAATFFEELVATDSSARASLAYAAANAAAFGRAPSNTPTIASAWRFGMMRTSFTNGAAGITWRAALVDEHAFYALLSPLFACGLLTEPRELRPTRITMAPRQLEKPVRDAFLVVRGLERPSELALQAAARLWPALTQSTRTAASPRAAIVAAALAALAEPLGAELDALSDEPPLILVPAQRPAADALAAWWTRHFITSGSP